MKLTIDGIKDSEFSKKNYILPKFDIQQVSKNSHNNVKWVHFGAGNIFRAFQAVLCQKMLENNEFDTGITVVECFDEDIINKAFIPSDNLSVAVSLKSDGTVEKRVVASVVESLKYSEEQERLNEIFKMDSLQMVSLSITEKGYSLFDKDGKPFGFCANDFISMDAPVSIIAILTKLMYERFKAGKKKIALVSMDNCSHNGTLLYNAVKAIANSWVQHKLVPSEFVEYLDDKQTVSFPWSMIDKITPRPAPEVLEMLAKDGLEGSEIVVTKRNTHISTIVNAEECEYLAIEDSFPNGRPPLEKEGVIFADRDTVDRIEKMKVCTCLNPLHTCLAIYGCLLGYEKISDEMHDADLVKFIKQIGYTEGLPVVVDPKVMSAKKFIDEVVQLRLPNPFMPDTPQRIATDTSKKLIVRFGETMKSYIEKGKTDLSFLTAIPLVFAGYARYLTGIDEKGETFELSPDPNLASLSELFKNFKLGETVDRNILHELFSNKALFGVDLYKYNLGKKVETMFDEMSVSKGAIRTTIQKYLN